MSESNNIDTNLNILQHWLFIHFLEAELGDLFEYLFIIGARLGIETLCWHLIDLYMSTSFHSEKNIEILFNKENLNWHCTAILKISHRHKFILIKAYKFYWAAILLLRNLGKLKEFMLKEQ